MFSPIEMKKWSKRNAAMGRETAALGDERRAAFAQALQGTKNQGYANVANIRNEGSANVADIRQGGFDRRLASEQEYGRPLQRANTLRTAFDARRIGADTERTQAGTEGDKFFNALTSEFGRRFMEKRLGGSAGSPEQLQPKSDVSGFELPGLSDGVANLPPMPGMSTEVGAPATVQGQDQGGGFGDIYDQVSKSPMGRALDMGPIKDTINYSKDVTNRILRGVGQGSKYMLTPKKRTKKEKDKAAAPFGIRY